MEAVVRATEDTPAGVLYVLRNIEGGVNLGNQNQLHPFYMVYLSEEGKVIVDHLSPKVLLDKMRLLCRGQSEPELTLCKKVSQETKNGRDMHKYSKLLGDAINSIIEVNEKSDIDSLFKQGGTTALNTKVTGLDDFELICFLIVK